MTSIERRHDRRIQRTQQLLRQAFIEIMREKGFAAMSVRDITERANVNRGTFYIHFTDKYMLLDEVVRDKFGQLVTSSLPPDPKWDKRTLHLLILTVLDCFEGKYHHRLPASRFPAALLERAIHKELTGLLFTWLKKESSESCLERLNEEIPEDSEELLTLEAKAQAAGWAIFGSAIDWSQKPIKIPAEQMADAILMLIMEGVSRETPGQTPG
ncbi:TetR/AcrR family transcriptional regulator [Paenibacillus sp. sptzw28]|uniref:TetR/AcrR family transcriptional regulator n=1 Tax=Paenibacillus sp. sptzw28 TaxID=715179 RepID=UPI001C6E9999|nr:TetR/AcrR family transcriptional regulator [Paenibacillus sp. sptzw28]QYR22894.1 TetR/AcrR family transcriptional regulator [Paenibacillus sp. sptzw28]